MRRGADELRLPDREVQLWVADITRFAPFPESLEAVLSDEERARAARFHFAADRDRFRVGRSLLRVLAAGYLGARPHEMRFAASRHGKPALVGIDDPLAFNVSHSGDLVTLAFSASGSIGVDVECVRDVQDLSDLANSVFTTAECDDIFADAATPRARFFQYWCAKESWLKADGCGLDIRLRDYRMKFVDPERLVVIEEASQRALPWRVRAIRLRNGYACAVCTRDDWLTVRTLQWSPGARADRFDRRGVQEP